MSRRRRFVDAWNTQSLRGPHSDRRIGPVDSAIADGSPRALRELGMLIQRRERAVTAASALNLLGAAPVREPKDFFSGTLVFAFIIASSVPIVLLWGGGGLAIVALIIIVTAALLGVRGGLMRRETNRCFTRWLARRCPECAYAVDGIRAVEPEAVAFIELGPASCPECGLPWPLVPPAIAAEPSASVTYPAKS